MQHKYIILYYIEYEGTHEINQTMMRMQVPLTTKATIRRVELKLKRTLEAKKVTILSYKEV